MEPRATDSLRSFYYSVVRVVPDPVREEAINVGIVVASAESGLGRIRLQDRVRTRVRAIDGSYDVSNIPSSLSDLKEALGFEEQPELTWKGQDQASLTWNRLDLLSKSLNNQIQITEPRSYLAASIDHALAKLFRRFVSTAREPKTAQETMTRSVLKNRILSVARKWARDDIKVESDKIIAGSQSPHIADVLISNGHPKAAIYAIPTSGSDRILSYLYRDSLPTIKRDMGEDFSIFAVLPPKDSLVTDDERTFAEDTIAALRQQNGVTATYFDDIDLVRVEVFDMAF